VKRIDIIYKRLTELTGSQGITAGELASDLGLSRANVSSDLNRLCDDKKAVKEGSKPVYYRATMDSSFKGLSLFDIFIKNNQSLFHAVEQAKAAVLYPPNGMHMLLFGETGVGKSMFAELVYKYGVETGKLDKSAPFVVFNCSDYANNPQLLVSQLFGAKKGAYTGADSDRLGLIEKADQGILFLDEIHRLPPEGQEMLFTFIDRGTFRRLGETDTEREATVLIIFATTEDPDSSLLRTFIRRIPMMIRIPNLEERNIDERLNLITQFLRSESSCLGKPIYVSVNSMRSLLGYRCKNNIGQLKTDIQLICAKAYSDFVSGKKDEIRIVSFDLPPYIKEGLLNSTNHRQIWNRLIGINKRYCVFDSSDNRMLFENNEDAENIYELIDSRVKDFKSRGLNDEQVDIEIDSDIRSYFEKYLVVAEKKPDFSSLENMVGSEVINVVSEVIAYSEEQLDRHFEDNIKYGLTVHIHNSINRINRNHKIVNPQLNRIRKEHSEEFAVALECLQIIDKAFEISMPIDEAGFIAMFFSLDKLMPCNGKNNVKVIIAAHGASTATSMANACNRLLDINHAVGFDVLLDENPQRTYVKIKEHLELSGSSDVLLLVDMGSLTNFGDELQNELGIRVKTIPLVSTLHTIEAVRKAIMGYSLDYVYQETMNVNDLLREENPVDIAEKRMNKMFIITVCTTGEGSAATVKNLLAKQLTFDSNTCEIIPLKLVGNDDVYARIGTIEHFGKVLCIVSSFKIDLNVPHFGLDDVFTGRAVEKIQILIEQEESFNQINKTLCNMLHNINSKMFLNDIRSFIENVENRIQRRLLNNVLIGVSCHIGCMIDRLKGKGKINEYPQRTRYIQENSEMISIIKDECKILNKKFDIQISDDEICYISTFFNPDNCIAEK
jgi:transcriptional regulatory protein LevR/transcriptional regulator with AAA-type ATPase domain